MRLPNASALLLAAAASQEDCARSNHQCGGDGYSGGRCCVDPLYSCREAQQIGAEPGEFMVCVKGAEKPPPGPPRAPPPPPSPPPHPLDPPPEPPFAPFVLSGVAVGYRKPPPSGSYALPLAGLALLCAVLYGLGRYSGLLAMVRKVRHGEGLQRISTEGDEEGGQGVGGRKKRRKRKGGKRGQASEEERGVEGGLSPRLEECALMEEGLVEEKEEGLVEEKEQGQSWLLSFECEHTAGLLAKAREVLQQDGACELSSISASTFVKGGDVWIRLTCAAHFSEGGGKEEARARVEEIEGRMRLSLPSHCFVVTLERQPA